MIFLTVRKQKIEFNGSFSSWREIIHVVPQGSILGLLLFNIYINSLFLFSANFEIVNYRADYSIFKFSESVENVICKLENDYFTLFNGTRIIILSPTLINGSIVWKRFKNKY